MSSRNLSFRLGDKLSGHITKRVPQTTVSHQTLRYKDSFFRRALAMAVDFSKLSCLLGQKKISPR